MVNIATGTPDLEQPTRSRVEITDDAEAERFLEEAYGAKLRLRWNQEQRHGDALLTHVRAAAGPFAVDEVRVAGDVDAAPDPLNKVVAVWASSGRVFSDCDGMAGEAAAGEVALLAQPDLPHRSHAHDLRATAVLLEPSVVAAVATGLPSGQAPLSIRFTSFQPIDSAAARLWKDTVRYVARTVLADDAVVTPLVAGHASRLLAAVMLSTFPHVSAVRATSCDRTDDKPVLLRRAIDFMNANATNDIALADIADAIHVTPRAVQYMFRRHLDTTPLQYLRRIRLAYAHKELLADSAPNTVTGIAARWGFAHTGRFAALYRQTYGQSPHTTLHG